MFTRLDRYLVRSLLGNYAVGLAVMLSLYVVLDMFVNMDEFTEHGYALTTVIGNMVDYYVPNLALYFSQLSGTITLFACAAALARMRKLNELTAILSSGVSLYRVARPVIVFGVLMTGLLVADTEWLIPSVAHRLARDHDDVDGQRAYEVLFLHDRDGALLSASRYHPSSRELSRLLVMYRDENGRVVRTLEAERASWEPPAPIRPQGRWRLDRSRQIERARAAVSASSLGPRDEQRVSFPSYYESDLSPEAIELRQSEGWVRFLSLGQLRELQAAGVGDMASIVQTRHNRVAQPIVSILLLLLGLPFFLDRSPANVLGDAGRCMLVCGFCYVITFIAQCVRPATLSPLPAWIPIFVFGTVAMVLLDRVRT